MTKWRAKVIDVDLVLRRLPSRDKIAQGRDTLAEAVRVLAPMFDPEPAIEPIPLAEPPILLVDNADLTIWRVPGAMVVRIGPADSIGAETIEVPSHMYACIAATFAAEAEGSKP